MKTQPSRLKPFTRIPADWKEWIADCLMMRVSAEEILDYMLTCGFETLAAKRAIEKAYHHPYVKAGAKIAHALKRRDWLLAMYQMHMHQCPEWDNVDCHKTISRKDFYRYYYAINRPVILTEQIRHWNILKTWTPQYFKTAFGDKPVEVFYMDDDLQKSRQVLPFAQYIDEITRTEHTNRWYMTNGNTAYNQNTIGELYNQADRLPELLKPDHPDANGWMLFGPKGNRTDLHYDLANNFFCQIYGRKHFKIISPVYLPNVYATDDFLSLVDLDNPDYEKFPLFKNVKIYDVYLEPGHVLFLPIGWWHYVISQDVSISLSFSNFYVRQRYYQFSEYLKTPNLPTVW